MICALYCEVGLGFQIAEAAGLTALIFISLSLYTVMSGRDFSFMGGFLFAGLMILVAAGLVEWIFGLDFGIVYPVCGAILFCGYIVYDTYKVMKVYGCDDYISAAIELYLDIIN